MPIVDGLTSTKMIREMETSQPCRTLSRRALLNGRVPIIAVSASLAERERDKCMSAGFDAWVLKPILFARLNELLGGIVDAEARRRALYAPGKWDRGGWFDVAKPAGAWAERDPAEGGAIGEMGRDGGDGSTPELAATPGAAERCA
jgi:hypothetical protein